MSIITTIMNSATGQPIQKMTFGRMLKPWASFNRESGELVTADRVHVGKPAPGKFVTPVEVGSRPRADKDGRVQRGLGRTALYVASRHRACAAPVSSLAGDDRSRVPVPDRPAAIAPGAMKMLRPANKRGGRPFPLVPPRRAASHAARGSSACVPAFQMRPALFGGTAGSLLPPTRRPGPVRC